MDDFTDLHIDIEALDFSDGEEAWGAAMETLRNVTLQPPSPMRPSQWIEANIELDRNQSSRAGYIRLHGYQTEIADAFADPEVTQITLLKSKQVGYSKCIAWITAYLLAWEGTSVLVAEPTDKDAEGYFKDNLDPLLTKVPALSCLVRQPSRGEIQDTWDEKRLTNGARLLMRGAASDDSFRRVTSRINIGDEVDALAWRSGKSDSQGDKFELLRGRGTDFWDSKLAVGGTPVFSDTSLIWREYKDSDQRKFFVTCPHCGFEQYLQLGGPKEGYGLFFDKNADDIVTEAWFVCEGPKRCRIDEEHKESMIADGRWIATATAKRPGHRGYHVWAAYSLAPKASWMHIAQEWVDAVRDPDAKMQTFYNLTLGLPYDVVEGKSLSSEGLCGRTEAYPAEVPDGVAVLVAGIDKQSGSVDQDVGRKQRLECSVWGFGRDEESWLIGHFIFDEHELFSPESVAELDALLLKPWRKRDGSELFIQATAIDLGGGYTQETKDFARQRVKRNVWAVKGNNNKKGIRSHSVWPRKASRKNSNSWYMLDTQLAKDTLGIRLRKETPGAPGYMHFPHSVGADYFEGLVAEKLTIDKKTGARHWEPKNKKANSGEPWDCLVYAYAALQGLKTSFKSWSSLSLAADRLNIPKEPVEYTGPDRSAQSFSPDLTVRSEITFDVKKPNESTPVAVEQKQVAPIQAQVAEPKSAVIKKPRIAVARSGFMGRR